MCVTQLGAPSGCVPDLYAYLTHMELKSLGLMSKQSLRKAQEDDEAIGPPIQAIKHGCWPDEVNMSPELSRMKRESGELCIKDGLLYQYSKRPSG